MPAAVAADVGTAAAVVLLAVVQGPASVGAAAGAELVVPAALSAVAVAGEKTGAAAAVRVIVAGLSQGLRLGQCLPMTCAPCFELCEKRRPPLCVHWHCFRCSSQAHCHC